MKLWILKPVESLPEKTSPWEPWYDKAFAHVVRAENEEEARKLAEGAAGAERSDVWPDVWLDAALATCEELTADGPAEVIVTDTAEA